MHAVLHPSASCRSCCSPDVVVYGEDAKPYADNGDGQEHRGGNGLGHVPPAADAPEELLHQGNVPPQPPVAPAEPDLHAPLAPPAPSCSP